MLNSTVVFSEIMYNPAGTGESLEWLELHNQMSVDIDMSGWRLDNAVDYTFPVGTIIGGGDYLVIAAAPIVGCPFVGTKKLRVTVGESSSYITSPSSTASAFASIVNTYSTV